MSSARRSAQNRLGVASSPAARFVIVFLVALAALGAIGLDYRDDPFYENYVSDANSYDRWAGRLARTGLSEEPTFHQSPLFPLLLSTLYDETGVPPRRASLLLQSLLLALAFALLVPLCDRLFGSPWAGPAAALVALLYAPLAFHSLKLLPLALALATQALALVLLLRARERGSALDSSLAGLALGLACIARAEMLLFVPIALLALAAGPRRSARFASFTVGLLLAIAPITAHNMSRGDPILIASSSGENLFIGNRRGGDGGHQPLHPKAGDLFSQRALARKLAEDAAGRPLGAAQVSDYWRSRAWQEIRSDPSAWIRLEGRKLGRLLDPGDPSDMYSLALERERYLPTLRLLALSTPALWLLGIVGLLCVGRAGRRKAWPLLALLLLHVAVLLVFFVSTRLRLPFLFWLCPFGGVALVAAWSSMRTRRAPRVAVVALGVLLLALLEPTLTRPSDREIGRLAAVLSADGRLDEAIAVLEPSIVRDEPDPTLLDQAGWVYSKRGELERSLLLYDQALGAGLPAQRLAPTWSRKARLLERMGRLDEASAAHDSAIAAAPEEAGAWYERGLFRLRQGATTMAISDLERSSALVPEWPAPREALRKLHATPQRR